MVNWKETLSEALRLFFLGVGISTYGAKRFRPDLARVSDPGSGWQFDNCKARPVEHEGRPGLRLTSVAGDGLASPSSRIFSTGKIDLSLAVVTQQAGLLLQPLNQEGGLLIRLALIATGSGLEVEAAFDARTQPALSTIARVDLKGYRLNHLPIRVVLTRETVALYINHSHLPSLKESRERVGIPPQIRTGLWCKSGVDATFTGWKIVETDEWGLK